MHRTVNLFLVFFLAASVSSCTFTRYVFYNFADIQDYKKFPKRELEKSSTPFLFHSASQEKLPLKVTNSKNEVISFDQHLEKNKTVAFLVIQNDSIQYERYFKKYDEASIVPSFSMAKSILSILIGCAIDDGLIKSIDEPITNYIPELIENGFEKVTLKHLLQMTSGLKFNEGYANPFGHVANFYYGLNLRRVIKNLKLKTAPGTEFDYVSGSPQILGWALERALKDKKITDYLQEKVWGPLEMEYDASWSLDKKKNGLEKTFCCINARARDFAKIGRLYLNKGNWNGKQIVSREWVEQSTKVDETEGAAWYYQYQWWLPSKNGDFMAQGILGQYTYVNPSKNLIIVRLGKQRGNINWWRFLVKLAAKYDKT